LEKYADQVRVFQDLGQGVLGNAWEGYNATLFAYGQTGSGKSYSVVGYGPNKGIVPITCEELFKKTAKMSSDDKSFQISYSMLEIYNENVRDLLAAGSELKRNSLNSQNLKVRHHPKYGFFVEGLKVVPVESYDQIKSLMEQGTLNRTTAATNLNATSSRSHMLIRVTFKQASATVRQTMLRKNITN
jgi:kinesin family protein 1